MKHQVVWAYFELQKSIRTFIHGATGSVSRIIFFPANDHHKFAVSNVAGYVIYPVAVTKTHFPGSGTNMPGAKVLITGDGGFP